MPFYNCHVHLFTIDHVPDGFAGVPWLKLSALRRWTKRHPRTLGTGLWLTRLLLKYRPFGIAWLIRAIGLDEDSLGRIVRFAEITLNSSQSETYDRLRVYYPRDMRFVVLPMDMAAMGLGDPLRDIRAQHDELLRLAHAPETGRRIIPFAAVDPRRRNALELLTEFHERGCKGLKIYPNLGYPPDHPRLMEELYPYCVAHNLPVMTHCSRGGVRGRVKENELDENGRTVVKGRPLSAYEASSYADPAYYMVPLSRFPDLRICLAHFGGDADWTAYLTADTLEARWPENIAKRNWVSKILSMLEEKDRHTGNLAYPKLYTDISYTIFHFEAHHRALRVFLSDKTVEERVLFGSDFYMTEIEEFRERNLSLHLRAELGENLFAKISFRNVDEWLRGRLTRRRRSPRV